MTTYSNVITAKTASLAGSTVDTVTFLTATRITVVNHSTTETIWFKVDGGTPAVDGDDSIPILPSNSVNYPTVSGTVKLIAGGTAKYTVVGL